MPRRFKATPHARGSTRQEVLHGLVGVVYPACAGIHPGGTHPVKLGLRSTPHARGSTPACTIKLTRLRLPHARGSPPATSPVALVVYRMRGITSRHQRASDCPSTPHARISSSFRTLVPWLCLPACAGSTLFGSVPTLRGQVYPACAGIHLFLAL